MQYGDQKETLPLIIVKGNRPAIFGRNWLEKLKLDWKNIFTLGTETKHGDPELQGLLQCHSQVFSEELVQCVAAIACSTKKVGKVELDTGM